MLFITSVVAAATAKMLLAAGLGVTIGKVAQIAIDEHEERKERELRKRIR